MHFSRQIWQFSSDLFCHQKRHLCYAASKTVEFASKNTKKGHCYNSLFPWNNQDEFSNYLASTLVYQKGGLIALNKPFGIKSLGKSDKRTKTKPSFIVSPIPECNFTIEDSLDSLKSILNVKKLSIVKSAERFTSGIVLLSCDDYTTNAVKKSLNIAKIQKTPALTHWMITLGYPVVNFREEKVALKFLEAENEEFKQPIIVTEFSKNEVKNKKVYPVHVIYRAICVNPTLQTSMVEISSSSVKWHFVRVYASSRIAAILGDAIYSNRMNTFMGMPVKLHIEQASAFGMPPISEDIAKALYIEKGIKGHSRIPTMLHLRSIFLPRFKNEDVTITANLPTHFQWTAEQLKLVY
ncbi:hypothetical protein JTE90_024859 [Oedothorax gibbosus]|uniref:Uncharacterized protein n=1 Tax=Oedothorax gibbosus TaxID=931172 RepID=A0AAV6V249_9ARAC|nr:hypothetical protein JTE90_024859 [Oedothorax gibbosus]